MNEVNVLSNRGNEVEYIPAGKFAKKLRTKIYYYADKMNINLCTMPKDINAKYAISTLKLLNRRVLASRDFDCVDFYNNKKPRYINYEQYVCAINQVIDDYIWDTRFGCTDWRDYLYYDIPIALYAPIITHNRLYKNMSIKMGIPYTLKKVYTYCKNRQNRSLIILVWKLKDVIHFINEYPNYSKGLRKDLAGELIQMLPKMIAECKDERLQLFRLYSKGRISQEGHRWYDIIRRCYDKNNKDYKWYGAKGITMCAKWLNDKYAFIEWVLLQDKPEDWTLDRIDAKKGYSPDNCIMIPRHQNCVKKFEYGIDKKDKGILPKFRYYKKYGGLYQFQYFVAILGLSHCTYRFRIKAGYTLYEALNISAGNVANSPTQILVRAAYWHRFKDILAKTPDYEFEIFLDEYDQNAYYIKQNEVKECPKCKANSARIEINPKARLVCDECGFDYRLESDYKVYKNPKKML